MKRKGGRFARDAAQVFGGQVAMTVIGVVTGIITARALGPHDRGLFQLLVLLPATLSNFAKFGIPQANVYFMRRKGASARDIATNSLWLSLFLGGILAVVCWVGRAWLLERVIKDTPEQALIPVLVVLPAVLLQAFLLGVAQAEERFREYNIQQVVPNVLGLVGMTVSLVVLHQGLLGAVYVQMGILVFVSGWLLVRVHRRAGLGWTFKPTLARGMLGFGGKSYVQTLAATLHLRIDQYMIAYFLDPQQVGYYAIAVNFTNLLLRIPDATGTVLFPRIAGADDEAAHAATSRVCRHTLFLTSMVALAFLVVGPFAIPLLFGERYVGAVKPMLILLPGIVVMGLYLILTRNFTSRGRQELNILAAALALVLNVGSNWFLIPRWGIAGAAASNCISCGTAALVLLWAFVRDSGHSVGDTVLVRRDDLAELARMARGAGRGAASRAGGLV